MDTRLTYTSPEQIKQRAAEALGMIEDLGPDIIFVTDDNALRDVAVAYNEEHPEAAIPTVFSGINVDPSIYTPIQSLGRPREPITGALERVPYFAIFELGKRLFPAASRVVILGDNSGSSQSVANAFQQDYADSTVNAPLEVLDFVLLATFEEWKKTVLDYQDAADIIGILNYHQLTDENGAIVTPRQVVDWMVANNQLPELGLVAEWAEDGILVSAGNSGYKAGIYAGTLGGRILGGEDPGAIPIADPQEIDAAYNLERAKTLGVTFPPEELAAAAAVYDTLGGGN
jgi:putative ABC transport system substrate-binding protein